MLNVTLLSVIEPDRKIQAIKNLRAATGMSLRDAKFMVDDLCHYSPGVKPAEISVTESNLSLIEERFTFRATTVEADPARLALRAALTDVSPDTLESLALALPVESASRSLLVNAAALMRSVGT